MQNISPTVKANFINFVSYGNAVLNCSKELIIGLFPNNSYCEMRYYHQKDNVHEDVLEVRGDKGTLVCYFDEVGNCDVCYVHFDSIDEVGTYLELCNKLFEYCPNAKRWKLCSSFIMYFEREGDKYFGFFANRLD
ncbi:hypothetical protein G7050_07480 [Dysgonomonas sp. HDW5A]|uniref:hypothetical protein n=1 Tax=Dysgonomonas sp. HDW5A TaxID=2714926 RepID=UPI001408F877|nr:hypothetical protein [Dysgonomonas sp. HDW5A]QIK59681.1 hypothetical protein G7050_07480 [Dysgonomonas sp. HDW5A]